MAISLAVSTRNGSSFDEKRKKVNKNWIFGKIPILTNIFFKGVGSTTKLENTKYIPGGRVVYRKTKDWPLVSALECTTKLLDAPVSRQVANNVLTTLVLSCTNRWLRRDFC